MAALDREQAELEAIIANDAASQEAKLTEIQRLFRRKKDEEKARVLKVTDSEYWLCLCFLSRAQKQEFLVKSGWANYLEAVGEYGDKHIDGLLIAESMGIELPDEEFNFVKEKPDKRLNEISLPFE